MTKPVFLDIGNGWIKGTDETGLQLVKFPHALRLLRDTEADEIEMRGGNDNPSIFKVGDQYYAIGAQAQRSGIAAVRYGESRYVPEYYGVLAAIAMFKLMPKSERAVFIYGSHTPKDLIYRQDLVQAVRRPAAWVVEGVDDTGRAVKRFNVTEAQGADEPVMAYRHAVMADDGQTYRGEAQLRRGICLVIDIGTFTTAFTIVENGKVDYQSSRSIVSGVADMLEGLETAIRRTYRTRLKGANTLPRERLEDALMTGAYNAGMVGALDVQNEVNEVTYPHINQVMTAIEDYGGIGSLDSVLIAGGGGALQEKRLREAINRAQVYVAEHRREHMQFATSHGMRKVYAALLASGRLKAV